MFVHPTRLKTLGGAIVGTLALNACTDPVANTDLRPEGPPDVLAVLVFNDPSNGVVESATYCKPNDDKRPGKVGIPAYGLAPVICPVDGTAVQPLADADPNGWYVRVVFDELLDPSVETLDPILDAMGNETDTFTGSFLETQPVTLKCQGADAARTLVDVPYDGYYSPSGNNVTWPLGPSIVIKPNDATTVPVESECEITLKDSIKDKDGNPIPSADRQAFKFKIAPVSFISAFQGPVDGDAIDPIVGGVDMTFNVEIDATTPFCADPTMPATCFAITPAAMAQNQIADGSSGAGVFVGADLLDSQTYMFTSPDILKVKDKCGIESTVPNLPEPFTFTTNPMKVASINPAGGNAVAASKKITVTFNQVMDASTFTEGADFTITPKPANFEITPAAGPAASIRITGQYNIGTNYVFTIKSGAAIKDIYGTNDLTISADQVANYTTVSAIAITAQSPAEGARITKLATAAATVKLTFNQEIDAASLDMTEFTLTKADGSPSGVTPTFSAAGAVLTVSAPALPAGTYTFTLKQGATLNDNIVPPNTYTQAADRVIHFTVADAPPPGPAFKCLGAP